MRAAVDARELTETLSRSPSTDRAGSTRRASSALKPAAARGRGSAARGQCRPRSRRGPAERKGVVDAEGEAEGEHDAEPDVRGQPHPSHEEFCRAAPVEEEGASGADQSRNSSARTMPIDRRPIAALRTRPPGYLPAAHAPHRQIAQQTSRKGDGRSPAPPKLRRKLGAARPAVRGCCANRDSPAADRSEARYDGRTLDAPAPARCDELLHPNGANRGAQDHAAPVSRGGADETSRLLAICWDRLRGSALAGAPKRPGLARSGQGGRSELLERRSERPAEGRRQYLCRGAGLEEDEVRSSTRKKTPPAPETTIITPDAR